MFARTARLTLRPGWPEDARALARAIAHPEVAFRLARLPWPYYETHARDWLTRPAGRDDVSLLILAHDRATPALIGGIGIHRTETGHELGYWLTPSAWGHGYATEAGQAMLGIARHAMGLKRLESGHFVDNPASGRVLAKLGFRPLGRVEQRYCMALDEHRPCALLDRDLADEDAAPCRLAA